MGEFVNLEVADGVGTIRLSRPPMNALNRQLQEELRAAAHEASERADVRAVRAIRRREGVRGGRGHQGDGRHVVRRHGRPGCRPPVLLHAVAEIPKPVVAAITGFALGGGCELALCADVRVCAGHRETRPTGNHSGHHSRRRAAPSACPADRPGQAKDLIFTGRFVAADEALAIGLVDGSSRPRTCTRGREVGRPVRRRPRLRAARGQGGDRTRPRRRTWTPAWRSNASSSPPCSPPRPQHRQCAPSWQGEAEVHGTLIARARNGGGAGGLRCPFGCGARIRGTEV